MKELFKSLNNVSIDCDDYDAGELTELGKTANEETDCPEA